MCRIAGILDFQSPPSTETITRVRDAMKHGGPDDSGVYIDPDLPLAFGFRRLSLLDLSSLGHQPMIDPSGEVILMFNGEIYNFRELRQELQHHGYSFQSQSDTEVILNAYLEWGPECFKRFNGMFAIALFDKRKNKIILARDHAGIKPLYYNLTESRLVFASEIRAFKTLHPQWPENNDWKKLFLIFGHLPEPVTTLSGVQPLPKGTFAEIDAKTLEIRTQKFFTLYYNYSINDRAEAIARIRETLRASVTRHLISDAPIGLFLSGGLDSSLLTILAQQAIPNGLKTLSIVFEDERYSEKYYQDLVIRQTKADHRSFLVTRELFEQSLPDIFAAMDQPSTDGINSYFITKFAHEFGLKAALSGIGADELFGGYPSFKRAAQLAKIKWMPAQFFVFSGVLPEERFKRIGYLGRKDGLGDYLFNRGFFTPSQVANLLDCTAAEVDECLDKIKPIVPHFVEKLEPLERASFFETNLYMQNQLLKDTDYMSMWHGLEVRVPFLDKELVELTYSIDPVIRYNGQYKALLVDAFKDLLPKEIYTRTKQGFSFPFGDWMKNIQITNGKSAQSLKLQKELSSGKIHWSRYWSFILTQQS